MNRRFLAPICLTVLLSLNGWQCSNNSKDTKTPAIDTSTVAEAPMVEPPATDDDALVFDPGLDTPEELAADLKEIYGWFPEHAERLDYAMGGVSHIYFLGDLGLDRLETTLPGDGKGGYPTGNSMRMKLSGEKTALAYRFVVDTLPGPRARGEGILSLFAVHCTDLFGMDIEIPRIQAGTGRFDLYYNQKYLMAQLSCCDMPPRFWTAQYGTYGDTLALVTVFDTNLRKHVYLFMGPRGARVWVGNYYCKFRTERGEFHRDETEPPYMCDCEDPAWINFTLGTGWRGRKAIYEPILRVTMF